MKSVEKTSDNNNENQFSGMKATLNMFQQVSKMRNDANKDVIRTYLTRAFNECDTLDKKKLFYSLIFSFGDIANRKHNIFRKLDMINVDDGGNSQRKCFIHCLEWMLTFDNETREQFYNFMPLIKEYTNIENLFINQVRSDRGKGYISEIIKLSIDIDRVTDFIAQEISSLHTSDASHTLWAKFISLPISRYRKRNVVVDNNNIKFLNKNSEENLRVGDTVSFTSELHSETVEKERQKYKFLMMLSKKLNWKVIKYKDRNVRFVGLEEYKKKYLSNSEAHLFSSKKILSLDKEQFINWLNTLSSGARYRVQRRLFNNINGEVTLKTKWINDRGDNLGDWFSEWLQTKKKAQEKLLTLSEENKKSMTAEELNELRKNAKINIGGDTLIDALSKWKTSSVSEAESMLVFQSIYDKIKIDVPVLMFLDVSSSMSWERRKIKVGNALLTPHDISLIALTAFLMKNPLPELKSMFGVFSTNFDIVSDYSYITATKQNMYVHLSEEDVVNNESIIDSRKHFIDNYKRIESIVSNYLYGSTNIEAIAESLKEWTNVNEETKSIKIEQIQKYPVQLFISDGDFNSSYNSRESILQYKRKMKEWFNWDDLIVIWDCKNVSDDDGSKFNDIDNVMYFGSCNPSLLNQVFTNINNLDKIDAYLPLNAIYRSDRYLPVRNAVMSKRIHVRDNTNRRTIAKHKVK